MVMICDVQNRKSDMHFKLTKVGVTDVKKLVTIERPRSGYSGPLVCSIDIFVDLPADQKGSHMSRNLEVIREIVDDRADATVTGIEDFAADICRLLLEKHEYATTANVDINAEYFRNNVTPHGKKTTEVYKLIGRASGIRDGNIRKTLGVECIGMTACPCAQENVAQTLGCSKEWPVITHNQRNVSSVIITTDEKTSLEANDLIDLINGSYSSPTFELLKRDDEAAVVINAHENPRFVEDMVRIILSKLVRQYPELPDDTDISVRSVSEESIHKHNAFAERTATMGELRE